MYDDHEFFKCDINTLFEKKFTFASKSDWNLNDIKIENTTWSIDVLNCLKKELNDTKSLLNDKGQHWHEHTAKINKAAFVTNAIKKIIQPEILTQAWCKFYEIVSSFHLIPINKENIRSLHLCEAPGAFVSALNYYLCLNHPTANWEWMANTLNPYYEGHSIRSVVVDDRLLLPTLQHWYFGQDDTGDISDSSYIEDLCNIVNETGFFDLVTADGSVDCLDNPGEQEVIVEKLHFSEVLIALNSLLPQGCLILKKFTFFECSSISQLFLLNCAFEKVHVFKPFTSRPSNSEVYVICTGFLKSENLKNILQMSKDAYSKNDAVPVFPQSLIPKSFLQQIEECMKIFSDLQIKAIKENLMLYPLQNDVIIENIRNLKETCAEAYIQKYSVVPSYLYESSKLFPKKKVLTSFGNEFHKDLKGLYFHCVGDTFNNIKKSSCMQWLDKLMDVEKRINDCFPISRKRPLEKVDWQFPWKDVRKRMKSKSFSRWIVCGKRVTCVKNSKFCYPVLLHLWNRISLDPMVDVSLHLKSEGFHCTEAFENIFKEEMLLTKQNIGVISLSQSYVENDLLLFHLKQDFNFKVSWCLYLDMDPNISMLLENKIIYINTTTWENSLNNENAIKESLTEALLNALMNLKDGDVLFICIQSLLTRYTAGLIFLLISLFEKFTSILPGQYAPASMGQIWIFNNFKSNEGADKVVQHLKFIKEVNSGERKVLEIVPITSLCVGSFYVYLRNLNNAYLLQKLRALVATERSKIEISMKNS